MPRLSANLGFLWPDRPLLARIDAAAKAGFAAIELHWPYDVPAAEVRAACDRHGLTLLGINTPVGSRPGDFGLAAVPGREAEFAEAFRKSLDYARACGAAAIHVMAGVVPADSRGEGRRTLVANLAESARAAEAASLGLLLEPINRRDRPDYFYAGVADAAAIMAEVNHPALSIMFDTYHVATFGADVVMELERHFPLIGHVQIAAVPDRTEPDHGDVDHGAVFRALDHLGYAGWVGCEYRPRGDTDAGLGWRDRYADGA
jgi:2-dehydrotetronate isomerase